MTGLQTSGERTFSTIENGAAGRELALASALRPANVKHAAIAGHPAGPFEALSQSHKTSGLRDVLVTGLMVIYPAFAVVAAIVAGLFLTGRGA